MDPVACVNPLTPWDLLLAGPVLAPLLYPILGTRPSFSNKQLALTLLKVLTLSQREA